MRERKTIHGTSATATVRYTHGTTRSISSWSKRRVCRRAGCPVAEACLAAGMREHDGMWGGLARSERRRRRKRVA
ncbi:MAG: WhiB family transcriptional regulator [Actinomycetota bacterium]|nr:WhiB family transcriptional regulator [Actinomycetota bacterium]